MREWTVLGREKPAGEPRLVAVRSGFSWGAFFFQVFWALYHGAWLTAFALLVIGLVVPLAGEVAGLAPAALFCLEIATAVITGLIAGELRILELHLRGYRTIAMLPARRRDEAEYRGFTLWLERPGTADAEPSGTPAAAPAPLWQP